ncbi:excinuclease ABC subunit C [Haloarcula pellucida]|uniref:UvrABC system protein C n=1 Tax=Haloarcula pellucida TaxID=1427151 RepID=A0A830GL21_9EURY|nr:excinuclease ABC subunit C [Halomicroarcula pellucida]MBX0350440.1 excinuclease ABC subunit C [Halomicroarcula pellucida]GGN90986.1 excinuclease ABC subunit C [Halomicroarcula pellucida]
MDPDGVCARAGDLPREPGVYQFEDEEGRVLYVGKAVDLRDRVRSYADPRSNRIAKMVERAAVVDFAVTDTETQALLLEANLIKRHRPPYNVRLKDDKSYPLVQLTDHAVPRIEVTRDPADGATVYGPFTDKGRVETVVKALRETYGLRGCSDHKYSTRDRPCLDYEMGICTAPCTGEIGEADYAADVESVERFFEGEVGVLADPLRREMETAAQEQEFERAANLRDKLGAVEALHGEGDAAVSDAGGAAATDVLGAVVEGDRAVVARLHAEGGKLVERERHTLDAPDGEGPEGVYRAFITQYYAEREFPGAILCAEDPADAEIARWLEREGVELRVPGAGREATLVDLALKNARQRGGADDEVGALADALGIDRPERIEGFDVSHAQGTSVVGSNVTVVGGSAETSDYRRKKLTERNDDYANMRELVRWRAERAVSGRDDRPDPDLLLIDGGDGQLGAARDALAETGWDVPAVALAKDEELVITPDRGPASAASGTSSQAERSYGVYDWPDDAPHLHLLQRVRDEAHRFAVQYHQTLRDEVSTALDDLPGVGPETRKRLLRRFGSVENVREASPEELTSVDGVGTATAETIRSRLG